MNELLVTESPVTSHAQRIEELGRVIMAYSEVTEKLHRELTELRDKRVAKRRAAPAETRT